MTAQLARGQNLDVVGTTNITSGTNSFTNTFVGQTTDGNRLNVSESGTVLTNSGFFYVGESGSSNNMVVSNGGTVVAVVASAVGRESSFNQLVVDGSNSTVTVTGQLLDVGFGFDGPANSNSLVITNGGQVYIGGGGSSIGSFNAQGNSVLVTGPGSTLSNAGVYFVGFQGAGNQLTLSNQGSLISDTLSVGGSVGGGLFGSNNMVLVTSNASITVNGDLSVGREGAFNGMTVSGGGTVTATNGYIGFNGSSSNNSVVVTGAGSTWINSGDFSVGHFGSSNSLVISNGGIVTNAAGYIGYINSSNNSVFVTGTRSVWSNTFAHVGYGGSSNNSLIISNGGMVAAAQASFIGYYASAPSNSVLVTGSDSVWTNGSELFIGLEGSGNSLVISNGGEVANTYGRIGVNSNSSNNSVLVTGSNSIWTNSGDLLVGDEGSSNSLVISNGGRVANAFGTIGFQTNSSNNSALVTGAGSAWTNSANLVVGNYGSGNRLVISDGGSVSNAFGTIGFQTDSSNNSVLVTGVDSNTNRSTWINRTNLVVGNYGSSNSLVISNGGFVANASGAIGFQTDSSNNSVTVTWADSIWSNSGDLHVGYDGSSNSMTLSAGGAVTSSNGYIGFGTSSSNNAVTVTGAGSAWTNSGNLFVGDVGSDNSMVISNGGNVVNADGYIGSGASSSNNSVVVTGTNTNGVASTWINTNFLTVGNFGSSNSLIISNGGIVEAVTSGIGAAGNSSNNLVMVTGAGSRLSNADSLYVGNFGSSNTLKISNGGLVSVSNISYIGHTITSSNNIVVVTGTDANGAPSTLTNAAIVVGYVGSGNSLVISNGGNVSSLLGSIIGAFPNSSNNTAMVTDAGSTWSNSGDLYVGGEGSSNRLEISNGGRVEGFRGYIGFGTNSSNNTVLVTGTYSLWTNTREMHIGYAGAGNQLNISNGGSVIVADEVFEVGTENTSSNNSVNVSGAGSALTNNRSLYLGRRGGGNSLVISNGGRMESGTELFSETIVGHESSSGGNSVLVTGSNSIWTNANRMVIGRAGANNSLTISEAGELASSHDIALGEVAGSTNNNLLVTDDGSTLSTGEITVGGGGSGNRMVVTNGAYVTNTWTYLGRGAGSDSNSLVVSGTNSRMDTFVDFNVGYNGSSNTLVVSDGATVTHGGHHRGAALGVDAGSSNNSALVTGSNSSWTSLAGFFVGYGGSGNSLVISNGGAVSNAFGHAGGAMIGRHTNASNNTVLVTGSKSSWSSSADFFVGYASSDNSLVITNGGLVSVTSASFVGFEQGSVGNTAVVAGTESLWTNGAIVLGQEGSGNTLTISNGGDVAAASASFIGNGSNAAGNVATVTGTGSSWTSGENFWVGREGSGNSMSVLDGGFVSVGADGVVGGSIGASNNTLTIGGPLSQWTNRGSIYIGGGSNSVTVTNGGTLSVSGYTFVAPNAAEQGNSIVVTGRDSEWTNALNVYFGDRGSGNTLDVLDEGTVSLAENLAIAYYAEASNNIVTVSGSGSSLASGATITVGREGSGNRVVVTNRGEVSAVGTLIGEQTNSTGNSVLVTGTDSLWTNSGNLFVGVGGSSNSLVISNGGNVSSAESYIGLATNSSNNSVVVTGSGSSWSSAGVFDIGRVGSGNRLTLSDDGDVTASNTAIGRAGGSSSNSMLVTGAGSTWTDGASFYVGAEGDGNSLVISNGGVVTSFDGQIGFWATASNNTVTVTGADSSWASSNGFYVGSSGSGNTMTISDRGRVASDFGVIGFFADSSNNTVMVTGTNSTWTNNDALYVGSSGSGNSLVISNGATVANNFGYIGLNLDASNNSVLVTGTNSNGDRSTWTNSGNLVVGQNGSGNSLVISSGAFVTSVSGFLSYSNPSSNNTVTVTDAGSVWTNSGALTIGLGYSGNNLVISNGGEVINTDGFIGSSSAASNNTVTVTGAGSTWTNSGDLYVGIFGTGNSLTVAEGGTIAAASIVIAASNGSSGTLNIGRFGANGAASTINAPTIAFGAGTGVINFNQSNTVTLSSVISGGGAVNQLGTGRSVLSGANTYTGPTTVSAGTLVAQSQTALGTGAVTLLGGTLELQSQLDIGSLLWDGAATIALPGAGAGQFLTVTGLLELTNGANNFNLAGATLPRRPVKLLTSTNLPSLSTNDFGVVGLVSYALSIEGDTLYLTAQDISYQTFAITPNQVNVATALDTFIGATGDRGTVSAALDSLEISQYPAAFEQLMPSPYASLPSMVFNVANALNSSLFQRMWAVRVNGGGFSSSGLDLAPLQAEMGGTDDMGVFAINPSRDLKWSSFVDGNGVFANASSTGSVQNYRSQSGGVTTGVSYAWNNNLSTGVYAGYQGLQAEYNSGKTIDNAVRFGVFGTYDVEDFYFNALVGGAYHGYTVNRYINFGGLDRTATGRPGAGEFNLALGTGYDFQAGDLTFGPFTTLQYTYLGVQGFSETGAGALNLDVDPYNSSSMLYTLGAQAAYNWKLSDKVLVTPTVFAGWQHEFLQNGYTINSSFATGGPASPFNYNTSSPARDNFYGGAGVTVSVGERWQASFIYSASAANENNSSQNLYLGLGYKF